MGKGRRDGGSLDEDGKFVLEEEVVDASMIDEEISSEEGESQIDSDAEGDSTIHSSFEDGGGSHSNTEEGGSTIHSNTEEGESTIHSNTEEGGSTIHSNTEQGEGTIHSNTEEGEGTNQSSGEGGDSTIHSSAEGGDSTIHSDVDSSEIVEEEIISEGSESIEEEVIDEEVIDEEVIDEEVIEEEDIEEEEIIEEDVIEEDVIEEVIEEANSGSSIRSTLSSKPGSRGSKSASKRSRSSKSSRKSSIGSGSKKSKGSSKSSRSGSPRSGSSRSGSKRSKKSSRSGSKRSKSSSRSDSIEGTDIRSIIAETPIVGIVEENTDEKSHSTSGEDGVTADINEDGGSKSETSKHIIAIDENFRDPFPIKEESKAAIADQNIPTLSTSPSVSQEKTEKDKPIEKPVLDAKEKLKIETTDDNVSISPSMAIQKIDNDTSGDGPQDKVAVEKSLTSSKEKLNRTESVVATLPIEEEKQEIGASDNDNDSSSYGIPLQNRNDQLVSAKPASIAEQALRKDDASKEKDSGSKPRWFRWAVVLAILLLIGVIVSAVCVSGNCSSSESNNQVRQDDGFEMTLIPSVSPSTLPPEISTTSPNDSGRPPSPPDPEETSSTLTPVSTFSPSTAGPTFPPGSQEFRLQSARRIFSQISSFEALETPGTPQYRALQWLALEDPLRVEIPSPSTTIISPPSNERGRRHIRRLQDTTAIAKFVQRYIVVVLYFALGGDSDKIDAIPRQSEANRWRSDSGFLSGILECSWYGLVCNSDEIIQEIILADNNLRGTLPNELGFLSNLQKIDFRSNIIRGALPSSLPQLSKLELLRLDSNALETTIPAWMNDMTTLREISLSDNSIFGTVPVFNKLQNLKVATLANNLLEGNLIDAFGETYSLEELYLDDNALEGQIDDTTFLMHRRMKFLDISDNFLSGYFPQHFYRFEALGLGGNSISGELPEHNLIESPLRYLSLFDNQLSGAIPSSVSLLRQLRYLDLSSNTLTGDISYISTITNIHSMESLFLSANNFEPGSVPRLLDSSNIKEISLRRTNRVGLIPDWIGNLTNLTTMDLGDNYLHGSIPTEIGLLTNLRVLLLQGNVLEGAIPETISNLESLEILLLEKNALTGDTSSICSSSLGNQLDEFIVDCDEVTCDCCTICCSDLEYTCDDSALRSVEIRQILQ